MSDGRNGSEQFEPSQQVTTFPLIGKLKRWPVCDDGRVFIWEAISIAGKAMFGAKWSGHELLTVDWKTAPDIGDQLFERWKKNDEAKTRLYTVVEWIARKARNADVRSWARRRSGGKFIDVPAYDWMIDDPFNDRVATGGFDIWNGPAGMMLPHYLFVSRIDLDRELLALPSAEGEMSTLDLSRVSPLLQLAISIAVKNALFDDPKQQPKGKRVSMVVDAFEKKFGRRADDFPTMRNAIATIIGWPQWDAADKGRKQATKKSGHS